jgi:hypothetical protein
MQATDFQEDSGDKESEKKSPTKVPVQPKCTSTVQLPHLPAPHNDILNATIGRLGSLTELHTAMFVNGLQRRTVSLEPPIISLDFRRRSSGFMIIGDTGVYGQLLRVFITDTSPRECVLYVVLYPKLLHVPSGQFRVEISQGVTQYIRPRQVGFAVVFAPWFDKWSMVPNPLFYAALPTDYPKPDRE